MILKTYHFYLLFSMVILMTNVMISNPNDHKLVKKAIAATIAFGGLALYRDVRKKRLE